ncbi:ribosomal protein S5 domain 2-like protein [Cystobasidium minutum MCA 4210]|uniref:mitochondrial 37S ribosomal protein uS9m n=1 Tax=Cystobasidium minutum MCA 4210 TaxID=1397322 RepID=UPI0034CE934A|eukprot:jgi/Rhomi1/167883/fgenesh1_kg.2_\
MSATAPSMLRQAIKPWSRMSTCQRHLCRQASTSSYYAQQQQHDVEPLPAPPKPPAATWYTGRPALNSFLDQLQSTVKTTRSTLYHQGYLSSVSQDVRTLSPLSSSTTTKDSRQTPGVRWLDAEGMASKIGTGKIRLAYYRQITSLLSELQALLPLLQQEGQGEELAKLLKEHARPDLNAATRSLLSEEAAAELALAQGSQIGGGRENNRGYGYLARDTGISFAIGRKKTASARAWILPLPVTQTATESPTEKASKDASSPVQTEPALGQILINSRPISKYFPDAAARSLILRPFSLTENLGKYNVFVLTSGGGPSSQAQATAVACARALAARDLSEEQVTRQILSKADLLRRDPRVVERKKTGKPKARKSFTWVKR